MAWRITRTEKNGDIYAHEVNFQRIELGANYFYFISSSLLSFSTSQMALQGDMKSSEQNIPDKDQYLQKLQTSFERLKSGNTIVVATFTVKLLQKSSRFLINRLISQRFNSQHYNGGQLAILADGLFSIFWVESKNIDKTNKNLNTLLSNLQGDGTQDGTIKTTNLTSHVNIAISILSIDAASTNQLIN